MTNKVSESVTLLDLATGLYRGEEYIRRVLGKMAALGGRKGDILVRVRIGSSSRMPDYRFEEYIREGCWQSSWPIEAFSGRTHKALDEQTTENDELWSNDFIEFSDLQGIIGFFRGRNELPKRST